MMVVSRSTSCDRWDKDVIWQNFTHYLKMMVVSRSTSCVTIGIDFTWQNFTHYLKIHRSDQQLVEDCLDKRGNVDGVM